MTDWAIAGTRLRDLRAELVRLDKEAESWRAPVALDQTSVGRLSRMDAMQQQAMSQAEARRRKAEIMRVDAALARLEDGEYGHCAECGDAITVKRLELDPAATHCIGCAK